MFTIIDSGIILQLNYFLFFCYWQLVSQGGKNNDLILYPEYLFVIMSPILEKVNISRASPNFMRYAPPRKSSGNPERKKVDKFGSVGFSKLKSVKGVGIFENLEQRRH
jgi:hypothetical protein